MICMCVHAQMTAQSAIALLSSKYAHILHYTPALFEDRKIELIWALWRGRLSQQNQSLRMGSTYIHTFYTRRYINREATSFYSRNDLLLQGDSRSTVGCTIGTLGRQGFVRSVHRLRVRYLDSTLSFPFYLRYCSG